MVVGGGVGGGGGGGSIVAEHKSYVETWTAVFFFIKHLKWCRPLSRPYVISKVLTANCKNDKWFYQGVAIW